MRSLAYDPNGIHIIEMFADVVVVEAGRSAADTIGGDEWDDTLADGYEERVH